MTIKCNAIDTVKTTEFFFTSISGQYSMTFSVFSCTQKEPYVEVFVFLFFGFFFWQFETRIFIPGE